VRQCKNPLQISCSQVSAVFQRCDAVCVL